MKSYNNCFSKPNNLKKIKVSELFDVSHKTMQRTLKRRQSIESDPINQYWNYTGRIPRYNIKLTSEIKAII